MNDNSSAGLVIGACLGIKTLTAEIRKIIGIKLTKDLSITDLRISFKIMDDNYTL